MPTKSDQKPGYRAQGKKRADGVKHGFAINPEQMDFERRKLLEEMSTKVTKNDLNNHVLIFDAIKAEFRKSKISINPKCINKC